jgi:UDP-N-acetylglucosamine 2-epimerase
MKKIVTVVGARPQFIKLAPFSRALKGHFKEVIIHTGQHYDKAMSDVFFVELGIRQPDYNLEVGSGSHSQQTAAMMIGIEEVLLKEKPDLVVVFGDTNSTLAATLVASKLGVKTVHVEAGLRSFNRAMPEELNRIASDHLSDLLFAPTERAMLNLTDEGLSNKSVNTGDIMVDSVKYSLEQSYNEAFISEELNLKNKDYYLLTLHRPYIVDNSSLLNEILSELNKLDKKIVFPVHPRTNKNIDHSKLPEENNFIFINPIGHIGFLNLMSRSHKIITDSGGIQKEAYILKVPCITLRSETEWVETVESGWNCLIDPVNNNISDRIRNFAVPEKHGKLFGENVAQKMIDEIKNII